MPDYRVKSVRRSAISLAFVAFLLAWSGLIASLCLDAWRHLLSEGGSLNVAIVAIAMLIAGWSWHMTFSFAQDARDEINGAVPRGRGWAAFSLLLIPSIALLWLGGVAGLFASVWLLWREGSWSTGASLVITGVVVAYLTAVLWNWGRHRVYGGR